jgi:hypothetical protein
MMHGQQNIKNGWATIVVVGRLRVKPSSRHYLIKETIPQVFLQTVLICCGIIFPQKRQWKPWQIYSARCMSVDHGMCYIRHCVTEIVLHKTLQINEQKDGKKWPRAVPTAVRRGMLPHVVPSGVTRTVLTHVALTPITSDMWSNAMPNALSRNMQTKLRAFFARCFLLSAPLLSK